MATYLDPASPALQFLDEVMLAFSPFISSRPSSPSLRSLLTFPSTPRVYFLNRPLAFVRPGVQRLDRLVLVPTAYFSPFTFLFSSLTGDCLPAAVPTLSAFGSASGLTTVISSSPASKTAFVFCHSILNLPLLILTG